MTASTTPLAAAEAVQRALKAAYPHGIFAVDDRADEEVACISVYAMDSDLRGDDIAWRCADLYARALAASGLPVEVDVEGFAQAGCRLDGETDGLAEAFRQEYGVDAIVVFAWAEGQGPKSGQLEAFTSDPVHAAILNGVLNRRHR